MSLQNLKIAAEMAATHAAAAAAAGQKPKSAWNQLDQLLTCAICLDRYRNPKLLPCQHTFCMEPCLEGLIDYVRRQIKCPECRAEHRIPYQGIQGYPTNVTLMRFLELHFEVTGELPDTSPTTMERCTVCSERSYLGFCAHCEKKVCTECKESHLDIMKREISRINNQVRRGLHRLQDALGQTDKSAMQLQTNCRAIVEEIDQVYTRLQKELKDRQETLKTEVQTFVQGEVRTAQQLRENLEMEVSNIESNCDLIEKHVTDTAEWEDVELMEYKDTFLKTLEFLRNFDPDQADFSRRIRFQLAADPEAVHNHLHNVGDLTITAPNFPGSCVSNTLSVHQHTSSGGSSGGLMRSKSEHRLASASSASQRQESYLAVAQRMTGGGGHSSDTETREGRTSPLSRRRTGDLSGHHGRASSARDHEDVAERPSSYTSRRYGSSSDATRSWQRPDDENTTASGSYRSRYNHESTRDSGEFDSSTSSSRSVRFARHQQQLESSMSASAIVPEVVRERVFETEDATRGPMSGIARLMDVPRVMQKLQQHVQRAKQPKVPPPAAAPPVQPAPQPQQQQQQQPVPVRRTARQVSEEDEIAKQKAQNKVAAAAPPAAPASAPTAVASTVPGSLDNRPLARRVAALQREELSAAAAAANQANDNVPSADQDVVGRRGTGHSALSRKSSGADSPTKVSRQSSINSDHSSKDVVEETASEGLRRRRLLQTKQATTVVSSDSSDDSDSDSADSKTPTPQSATIKDKDAQDASSIGQEKPNYFRFRPAAPTGSYSRTSSNSSVNSQDDVPATTSNVSRTRSRPTAAPAVADVDKVVKGKMAVKSLSKSKDDSSSDSSTTTNHAASAVSAAGSKTTSKDVGTTAASRHGMSSVVAGPASSAPLNKTYSLERKDSSESTTSTAQKPRFVSRFLPRTQSRTQVSSSSSDSDSEPEVNDSRHPPKDDPSSPIGALLARSAIARRDKGTGSSSAGRPAPSSSNYLQEHRQYVDADHVNTEGRYSSLANKYLARLSREQQDREDAQEAIGTRNSSSMSNKYLSKSKSSASISFDESSMDQYSPSGYVPESRRTSLKSAIKADQLPSRYSAAMGHRSGRLGRSKSSHELLHDDTADDDDADHYVSAVQRRGSARYLREASPAVSDDDNGHEESTGASSISSWARYLKNKYGYKGVSKDATATTTPLGRSRSSHALSSSSYHPREASFEGDYPGAKSGSPSLHDSTRSQSTVSHYAGYAGPINSSDKGGQDGGGSGGGGSGSGSGGLENPGRSSYLLKRRLQLKIGVRGSEPGCFTWPRGIAVGPDNGFVVADSSNHRVQVFDERGVFRMQFGSYGNGDGEFDCLAGICVNRIGQFIVSDRYNHRLQVFDPSGRFLRAFGSQGSTDGKLSYPWGVSSDALGFIYVADKENHRVQVYQSDGTFVGKFGSLGSGQGYLEHPHYVAVSCTNRVFVSDSNNHRVQVFDVNGKVISTFGSEGSEPGQFRFPRGIAVDDRGFCIVGDSGNNRVQIFTPDGLFLKAFGAWGSGDSAEFKGIEGIAVGSNGEILVCDRENHRIQIF